MDLMGKRRKSNLAGTPTMRRLVRGYEQERGGEKGG